MTRHPLARFYVPEQHLPARCGWFVRIVNEHLRAEAVWNVALREQLVIDAIARKTGRPQG